MLDKRILPRYNMENKGRAGDLYMKCEISKQFFDMLGEIAAEQKQPLDCGGVLLHRSEINLMQLIESCPDANVSALSEKSGVTKSAVTQISVKLCEKGLIETYKNPHNKKEKYFSLTDKGRQAKESYEELNKDASMQMRGYLCALSAQEKRTIMEFIRKAKEYMPLCSFNCSCGKINEAPCLAALEEGRKTNA